MRGAPVSALILLALAAVTAAQDEDPFAKAVAETRRDIETARERLVARRGEISDERIALADEVRKLEASVRESRDADRRISQAQAGADARVATLEERATTLEDQVDAIRSLLLQARRDGETQLSLVDAAARRDELRALDELLEAPETTLATIAERVLDLVASHAEEAARPRRTRGSAVGPDGVDREGEFLHLGDVQTLFAGDDLVGAVHLVHGSWRPHVWTDLPDGAAEGILAVAETGRGEVPFDVTAGGALRTRQADRSLTEQLRAGGVVMIPILAIGAIGLLAGLLKLLQLIRIPSRFDRPLGLLVDHLRNGRNDEAAALAARSCRPLRRVMETCASHRDATPEDQEEALNEAILIEVPRLERYLSVLSVGAAVAPLLGLLGTVTGMIRTFQLISVFGTGDPRLLSGGISEALITTEAGLVVAIPLVLLHAFLARRVQAISEGLEAGAVGYLNAIRRETNGSEGEAA